MSENIFFSGPPSSDTDWTAVITCIATVVGAVILFFYTRFTKNLVDYTKELARLAEESLREARNGSATALVETRRSNKATEESNKIAEQSMERGNRAWMILLDASTPGLWTEDLPSGIELAFKNTGRVPAIKVHTSAQYIFRSSDRLDKNHPLPEEPEVRANDIVGNGEGYKIPIDFRALNASELDLLVRREQRLLVYGRVDYSDCFEKCWSTEFCILYDLDRDSWVTMPFHQRMI